MQLDRKNGVGKYAIVRLRDVRELLHARGPAVAEQAAAALRTLLGLGVLEYGEPKTKGEFFVLRLRDKYAGDALDAYALAASFDDADYARDVEALAERAGERSPFCKVPD